MRDGCGRGSLRVLFVSRGLFTESDGSQSGFQTRTISEIEAIVGQKDAKPEVKVLLLDFEERRYPTRREVETIRDRLSHAGIESRFINIPAPRFKAPALIYFTWALESVWGSVLVTTIALKEKVDLIHTHGEWATFTSIAASKILRLPLVYETHGIVEELFRKGKGLSIGYRAVKSFEKVCIRNSWYLITVSEAMKAHFGLSYDVRAKVVPCGVGLGLFEYDERARSEKRQELMLTSRFVVVYSGSFLTQWQQPREMIKVFKEIKERIGGSIFLVLTTDEVAAVFDFLVSEGLEEADFAIRRVGHGDVPEYLMAGDMGLLIRARDIINQVACPVKFGEYMASGIPVLCTEGIGDISDIVRDHGVGLVLENEAESVDWDAVCNDLLRMTDPGTKEKCRQIARDMFDWGSNAAVIRDLYLELVKPRSRKET